MDVVPIVLLTSLVKKLVDTAKYASNGDTNAVVTQVLGWVSGVVATFLTASTDFAADIAFQDVALADANAWTLLLLGLTIGSAAGVGWDTLKALDGTNSAVVPSLLKTPTSEAPQGGA